MKKIVLVLILISLFVFIKSVKAINMESPRFRIQFGNINSGAGTVSSSGYSLSDTVGQLAAGSFESNGYLVKAGFQYMHSIIPFQFTVSSTSLEFSEVMVKNFSQAKTDLLVSFGSAGSYQVTAEEEGPLKSTSDNFIPNTLCNRAAETCTQFQAQPWTNNTAFGFGYNMQGDDIAPDFLTSSHFRRFADTKAKEEPIVIMSSSNVGKNRKSTMTLKLNVSSDQAAGTYQTVINFVATPGY